MKTKSWNQQPGWPPCGEAGWQLPIPVVAKDGEAEPHAVPAGRGAAGVRAFLPGCARHCAFTLLELLTVIGVIGILAAIVMPNIGAFKSDVVAAATQQLMTDVARARQLAISQRTTVYMVFVPPGFMSDTTHFPAGSANYSNAIPLLEKQYRGYNFVSLRSIGDQPGQHLARYLSSWKTLPEGTFISTQKFMTLSNATFAVHTNYAGGTPPASDVFAYIRGFAVTNNIPFPTEDAKPYSGTWTPVPYLAFNYLGQLLPADTDGNAYRTNDAIPIAKGSVMIARNPATKVALPPALPSASESPPFNSITQSFTLIYIDGQTGRTRVKRQEIR